MNRLLQGMVGFPVSILLLFAAGTARSDAGKVYVGLNAEAGHVTSTSDDAIRQGIQMAIEKAGSTDRRKVRDALEHLGRYEGLIRVYDPPFTPARHEALSPENVFMARYGKDGLIGAIR
jgi:hypothetical protein